EADEKIKFYQGKIQEKRNAEEAAAKAKSVEDFKGETELLSTPPPAKPVEKPIPESTELLNTPPQPEIKREEIRTEPKSPDKKEEIPSPKTEVTQKKSNKNVVITGSLIGIAGLVGVLFAS